jgi:hypothetical protein
MGCLPCFGSGGKGEPAKKPASAAGGGGARKDVPSDRRASGVGSGVVPVEGWILGGFVFQKWPLFSPVKLDDARGAEI